MFSIPLGLILGALAGYANYLFRYVEEISFAAIPIDEGFDFDDRYDMIEIRHSRDPA
jgi:hypothetical protein